jgi:hypothetical protein
MPLPDEAGASHAIAHTSAAGNGIREHSTVSRLVTKFDSMANSHEPKVSWVTMVSNCATGQQLFEGYRQPSSETSESPVGSALR